MAYVKRVVYPRESNLGYGDGWLSYETRLRIKPEAWHQQTDSYRTPPRRHQFSVYHHGYWHDELGWIVHPEPPAFSAAWVPAFEQSLGSFRTRRRPHIRPNRLGGHPPVAFDIAVVLAATDQLLGGFRTRQRGRLLDAYHGWLDDAGRYTPILPSTALSPTWLVGIAQAASGFIVPRSKRARRDALLWDSVPRTSGAYSEDVREWVPIYEQQRGGFRTHDRKRLDLWRSGPWLAQDGWLSFAEIVGAVTRQWPAYDQLASGFLVPRRSRYSPGHLDWQDTGSWLYTAGQFDPAFWPGIGDLLNAFRSLDGKRIDVRRLDTLFDAWISYEPTDAVPSRAAAYDFLWAGYRTPDRRPSIDTWRVDWSPDVSFLHDVLGLEDAEPITANDVAERWAGSVRRRQRARRR